MNAKITSPKSNTTIKKLLVDSLLFVAFLLVYNLRLTGQTIHEWLGITMGTIIIVHMLLSWNWIVGITKKIFSQLKTSTRFNYILNLALFIDFTVILMTGVLISKSVVGVLGITLPHDEAWKQLHFMASDAAIYLTGLHLAVNWRWVVNAIKGLVRKPVTLAQNWATRNWAAGGAK